MEQAVGLEPHTGYKAVFALPEIDPAFTIE